jgi:hypothetical protein
MREANVLTLMKRRNVALFSYPPSLLGQLQLNFVSLPSKKWAFINLGERRAR